ncbi:MAG TPA: DUF302 domain-containing protein [bacterium]|nr:DUF302 domain-containing protein [bacterium]
MPSWETRGIDSVPSPRTVEESLARLDEIVRSAGLTVFARIDFSGDAARAGLTMRPAQLLLFGNPKAGTPLMVAAPSVALDLPLKALVWEDAERHVWISYNTPAYLKERHSVPDDLIGNIAGIAALVRRAVA